MLQLPNELQFQRKSKNRLNSVDSLARFLGLTRDQLIQTANLNFKYKKKNIPKKNGNRRIIHKPCSAIRHAQSLINSRFIKPMVIWPNYVYGCIPNTIDNTSNTIRKDYIACAQQHCRAKSVAHIDIENFFFIISEYHINSIFTDFFKCGPEVSENLTKLVCNEGTLVQGALTSSYLATLLFHKLEPLIVYRFKSKGIKYTRLIDDITLSTHKKDYEFKSEIESIKRMLNSYDLNMNEDKLSLDFFSSKPIYVHNLRVDHNNPRYSKEEVRRIRTLVKNIMSQSQTPNYRTEITYRKDYYRCMGTVNKLSLTNHYYHKKFIRKIVRIKPLPSKKDIYNNEACIE